MNQQINRSNSGHIAHIQTITQNVCRLKSLNIRWRTRFFDEFPIQNIAVKRIVVVRKTTNVCRWRKVKVLSKMVLRAKTQL